jgi:hypothetical protein
MTVTRIGLPETFADSAHRMRFEETHNCITARCSCGWSVTYDKDNPRLPCQDVPQQAARSNIHSGVSKQRAPSSLD